MVAGLVGLVWCVLFFGGSATTPPQESAVNSAELALIRSGGTAEAGGHAPASGGVWRSLLTSRSLWAMAALYFLAEFRLVLLRELDAALPQGRPRSPVRCVAKVSGSSRCSTAGISCLVGGVLSDRLVRATGRKWFGRALFPMVGLTTAAAAMFAVRFVTRPAQAIILICLAGAAYDFGQGANWASIVDIGGRHAGIATGFINMLGNFSNAAQPSIGAWVFSGTAGTSCSPSMPGCLPRSRADHAGSMIDPAADLSPRA